MKTKNKNMFSGNATGTVYETYNPNYHHTTVLHTFGVKAFGSGLREVKMVSIYIGGCMIAFGLYVLMGVF